MASPEDAPQRHRTSFLLLQDFAKDASSLPGVDELRRQIEAIPGFAHVALEPQGASTVVASVPAGSQHETDRLRALLDEKISGWKVIEDQAYGLPKTY